MITVKYKNFDINFASISFRDIREAMMDYEKLQNSLGDYSELMSVKAIISMADDVSHILEQLHHSKAKPSSSDKEKVKLLRKLVLAILSKPQYNSGLSLSTKELTINLTDFLIKNKLIDKDKIRVTIAYKSDCIDFTYSMKDIDIVDRYINYDHKCCKCTSIQYFEEVVRASSKACESELYIYLIFIIVSAMRQGLNVSEGALIDLELLDKKQNSTGYTSCIECKTL